MNGIVFVLIKYSVSLYYLSKSIKNVIVKMIIIRI